MSERSQLLIIDDEESARDTVAALLYQEGYDLAFAANGPAALRYLDQVEPDVILLDVMMPEMDGFEVCRRLKADKARRHIPVILITALNDKEDVARGLDVGADEFLPKPVHGLELRARVRSMLRIKKQFDELTSLMKLREDLSGMIVHDMRVPLTTILGFSELLLRMGTLTGSELADVEKIHNQAQRLQGFINDLLMMAKSEHDEIILNRSPVDINQLISQVEQDHYIIAQSKKIDFVTELPADTSRQVYLDFNLVQRVLDNLISNALKFAPDESMVKVHVEYFDTKNDGTPSETWLRIKIIDEGPGVSPEYRQHIFDKFKVVNLKNNPAAQFGLGLTFCKLITEAHGGQIWVEANEPTGSIFNIEINGYS